MSQTEMELTLENKGLVRGKKDSRGAKWISTMDHSYRAVNGLEVVLDMDDAVVEMIKPRILDYGKMIGGESENMNRILIKSNEPGAMGVGAQVLDEFNSYIKSISVYRTTKGKRKLIHYQKK